MFAPRGWFKRPIHREIYDSIAHSGQFDGAWYRRQYRGVLTSVTDPLWHYLNTGWVRGFNPSPRFDTRYYLESYPDVKNSGINPLYHFVAHGQAEQRSALRSSAEIRSVYLPFTEELRFVLVEGAPRITVVVDPQSPSDLDSGLSAALAQIGGTSLPIRLIVREGTGNSDVALRATNTAREALVPVTLVPVGSDGAYSDLPRVEGERFVATSWSSAIALRHVAAIADASYLEHTASGAVSLAPLNNDAIDRLMSHALADNPPPALRAGGPSEMSWPASETLTTIVAYCSPVTAPLGFVRTLELIEQLLLKAPAGSPPPRIFLCGERPQPFSFWGSVIPEYVSHERALELVSSASLTIALSEIPLTHDIVELIAKTPGFVVSSADLPTASGGSR